MWQGALDPARPCASPQGSPGAQGPPLSPAGNLTLCEANKICFLDAACPSVLPLHIFEILPLKVDTCLRQQPLLNELSLESSAKDRGLWWMEVWGKVPSPCRHPKHCRWERAEEKLPCS